MTRRIKKLDTRILTVVEVRQDFGWRTPHWMFDDKFPYRTLVELGATDEDLSHSRELCNRAALMSNASGVHDSHVTICDPQRFADVLARLTH